MFKPRHKDSESESHENTVAPTQSAGPSTADQPRVVTPAPVARRVIDGPSKGRSLGHSQGDAEKKLIVGKGLSLAGEITSCDVLVVEGKVEAKLTEGKLLEIAEAGQFRGSVEIENADIAGRYDGQLVVHGRLTVRATGRISGMVKYGELEVCAGGQIIGEVQTVGGGAQVSGGTPFKTAARFAALTGDDDQQERKSA
jgi:cytoskeletal protein CcmA (bactofilin family)